MVTAVEFLTALFPGSAWKSDRLLLVLLLLQFTILKVSARCVYICIHHMYLDLCTESNTCTYAQRHPHHIQTRLSHREVRVGRSILCKLELSIYNNYRQTFRENDCVVFAMKWPKAMVNCIKMTKKLLTIIKVLCMCTKSEQWQNKGPSIFFKSSRQAREPADIRKERNKDKKER